MPSPVSTDRQQHVVTDAPGAQRDAPAARRVTQRVGDEVVDDLIDPVRVGEHLVGASRRR